MSVLQIINSITTRRDKVVLVNLLLFSIFMALFETFRISMMMPFISVSTNFDLINKNAYISYVYNFFGFSSPGRFVFVLGITISIIYLVQTVAGLIHLYLINHFSQSKYHTTSRRLFNNYLRSDYKDFTSKNSAVMHKRIIADSGNMVNIISAGLTFLTQLFTIICVYSMLLWIDFKMTLILTVLFSLMLFVVIRPCFKVIEVQGRKNRKFLSELYQIFNEAFGNFKLIKFLSNERFFLDRFSNAGSALARAGTFNATFQAAPRLILEFLAFIILAGIIIFVLYLHKDPSLVIPVVTIYGLAFYRLLPAMNQVLGSYNQILYFKNSLDVDDIGLFDHKDDVVQKQIQFNKHIRLSNITFGYSEGKSVLKNVDLRINKGDKVAFVGESGSGKSTLIDIITGVYELTHGAVYVDDIVVDATTRKSWRNLIGYIPQDTYLFDGTVSDNVVFGREYDEVRLLDALKKANIYDFLMTQEGLDTRVGEGGIKVSGGQKQRISIARALYSDPEILILDEATSALDVDTESRIMDDIYNRSGEKTLIVITHKFSTIIRCSNAYRIDGGAICPFDISTVDNKRERSMNV